MILKNDYNILISSETKTSLDNLSLWMSWERISKDLSTLIPFSRMSLHRNLEIPFGRILFIFTCQDNRVPEGISLNSLVSITLKIPLPIDEV